jgi:hypothetical protein
MYLTNVHVIGRGWSNSNIRLRINQFWELGPYYLIFLIRGVGWYWVHLIHWPTVPAPDSSGYGARTGRENRITGRTCTTNPTWRDFRMNRAAAIGCRRLAARATAQPVAWARQQLKVKQEQRYTMDGGWPSKQWQCSDILTIQWGTRTGRMRSVCSPCSISKSVCLDLKKKAVFNWMDFALLRDA